MSDILTEFGYTRHNYGRRYSFTSTHLNGEEILSDENLNPSTIIVSSPVVTASGNVLDTQGSQVAHSLFFTDYNGKPTRLTYTVMPGNGLVVNAYNSTWNNYTKPYTCDTLTLEIDHDSLKTTDDKGQLYVSKPDIIDNYTLMVTQVPNSPHSYISVITANLEKATNVKFGITHGDNYTISANDGVLNVNTYNLDYADDNTNTPGIVRPNPDTQANYSYRTVEASNGILHVITANLDRANTQQLGVVMTDGVSTVTDNNGMISVRTEGLTHGDAYNFGIVKVDDVTIHSCDGIINADSTRMTPTSINSITGESTFGVIKLDPVCFGIDVTNMTYINRYNELITLLDRYMHDYQYIMDWLANHESRIRALENQAAAEIIYVFKPVSDTSTILNEPVWNPEAQQVEDPQQLVSLQFQIKTNCSFNVSVTYKDNENPGITLQNVKLGNGEVVSASGLSQHIFSSTNKELNTLHMTFNCTNFNGSDVLHVARILTTATITVTSINDDSVSKVCTHTFLRWNRSDYIEEVEEPEVEVVTDEYTVTEDGETNYVVKACNLTDNMRYYEDSRTCVILNNADAGTLTSASFSFMLQRRKTVEIKKYRRTYKYVNGRLQEDAVELVETTPDTQIEYLSVPLVRSVANSINRYYFGIDVTAESFTRPVNITNESIDTLLSDDSWESMNNTDASTLEEANRVWYTYSTPTLASTTSRSMTTDGSLANSNGFNILNIASVAPSFNKDRKLKLTLKFKQHNSSTDSNDTSSDASTTQGWQDCSIDDVTVLFVENFTPNDCSMSVSSEARSSVDTPLKINITKSNLIPYDNTDSKFTLNIRYKYNTTTGLRTTTSSYKESTTSVMSDAADYKVLTITVNEGRIANGMQSMTLAFKNGLYGLDINGQSVWNINSTSDTQYTDYISFNDTDLSNIVPESVNNIISNGSNSNYERVAQNSVVKVMNNISGFIITGCECSGFRKNPDVAVNSIGTWPTYQPEPEQEMTFSDASITKITVDSWDDTMMRLRFNISPGSNTHIPVGSQVYLKTNSDLVAVNGVSARKTTTYPLAVKMYVNSADNTPYNYDEFYDHIVASCDGWTNTGCEFDIMLENILKPAPNPNNWSSTSQIVYEAEKAQMCFSNNSLNISGWDRYNNTVSTQLYVSGEGRSSTTTTTIPKSLSDKINSKDGASKTSSGMTNSDLNAQSINHPMVYKLWAIRFNFTIEAKSSDGKTTVMNFTPTVHDLCSKVTFDNATYNKSTSQNVNMVNAFYKQDNTWNSSSDVKEYNVVTQLAAATAETMAGVKDMQGAWGMLATYIESGMSVGEAILKVSQDVNTTSKTTTTTTSSTKEKTGTGTLQSNNSDSILSSKTR